MKFQTATVLYVVLMAALIVATDVLFFKDRLWLWQRLAANVGIVLVFIAFYFRFRRGS